MLASQNGHFEVVECLVKNKAEVDAKHYDGVMPAELIKRQFIFSVVF